MLSWVRRTFGSPHELFVDQKRINPEIQAERRRELFGNIDRRRKIMDRMVLGYACPHRSWVEEVAIRDDQDAMKRRPDIHAQDDIVDTKEKPRLVTA